MASAKIKKGDTVRVIAGAEKNNEGKVISVDPKKQTALIEGVHMIKKHVKPGMKNQQGGILEQEGPIALSNVMLVHNGKTTRVGFKVENGKKVRIAKVDGSKID